MEPASGIEALFRLQQIDLELAELAKKAQESEEAGALVQARERAERCRLLREKVERQLTACRTRLKKAELGLMSLEESLKALEARLYGGEVTHPKELAGLQERFEHESRRKAAGEEEVLAAMEALEQADWTLEKAKAAEAKAEQELSRVRARFEEAQRRWSDEAKRLHGTRNELRRSVAAELLALYDALRERFAGKPVAKVENRSCGGCHVEIPTSMRKAADGQGRRCPNCGRLLWWP